MTTIIQKTNISLAPITDLPNELLYLIGEYTNDINILSTSNITTPDVLTDFSESLSKRRDSERTRIETSLRRRIKWPITDQPLFIYSKLEEYINQFNLYDDSIIDENHVFNSNSEFTSSNPELIVESLISAVFGLYHPEKAYTFLMSVFGV